MRAWSNAQDFRNAKISAESAFHYRMLSRTFSAGWGDTIQHLGRCPKLVCEMPPLATGTCGISDRLSIPAAALDRDDWKPASRD